MRKLIYILLLILVIAGMAKRSVEGPVDCTPINSILKTYKIIQCLNPL